MKTILPWVLVLLFCATAANCADKPCSASDVTSYLMYLKLNRTVYQAQLKNRPPQTFIDNEDRNAQDWLHRVSDKCMKAIQEERGAKIHK